MVVDEYGVGGEFVSEGVFLGDEIGNGGVDLDCSRGGDRSEGVVGAERGVVGLGERGDLLDVGDAAAEADVGPDVLGSARL